MLSYWSYCPICEVLFEGYKCPYCGKGLVNNLQFAYRPVISQSFDLDLFFGTIDSETHVITTPGEKSWDEVMDEVMEDRSEAWDKLASL